MQFWVLLLQRHLLSFMQCTPHCHTLCCQKQWHGIAVVNVQTLVSPMPHVHPSTAQALFLHAAICLACSLKAICFHHCKQAKPCHTAQIAIPGNPFLDSQKHVACSFAKVPPISLPQKKYIPHCSSNKCTVSNTWAKQSPIAGPYPHPQTSFFSLECKCFCNVLLWEESRALWSHCTWATQ